MNLEVFSHCAIDTINLDGSTFEQIGGSACYCSLTAREFKFDVNLHTKFGSDFPTQYFTDNKIRFDDALSEKPTTRFEINISGPDRTLQLQNQCDAIDYDSIDADGVIVSPIFHEINNDVFSKIKENSNFLLVDPQGFLRQVDSQKNIYLEKTDMDFTNVHAVKVNPEEMYKLVGKTGDDGMLELQKIGFEYVLSTNKTDVSMLVKDKVYSITLPNKEIYDTTGIGDIFCATFTCIMLKEKDFLWALCFAGGAAQAALESKQLGLLKIPKRGAVETNASYFYNLLKYRQI